MKRTLVAVSAIAALSLLSACHGPSGQPAPADATPHADDAAIFSEADLPPQWAEFAAQNAAWFER